MTHTAHAMMRNAKKVWLLPVEPLSAISPDP